MEMEMEMLMEMEMEMEMKSYCCCMRTFIVDEDILLYEILPRLPIKSLFRFKSVCKKWCTFISNDPTFITYQYYQSQKSSSSSSAIISKSHYLKNLNFISITEAAVVPNLVGVPDPSLSYLTPRPQTFSLHSSTNGLLCGNFLYYDRTKHQFRSNKFFVCNPVTKDFVIITKPTKPNFDRIHMGLAFNPSLLSSSSSSSSSHFELISQYRTDGSWYLHNFNDDFPKEIGFEVFSSKTGVWRVSKAKLVLSKLHLMFDMLSIFTDGKLHWLVTEDIIWFDPSEDRAGLVFSPPGGERKKYPDVQIGECIGGGGLNYTKITSTDIEIWVMRDTSNGRFQFKWTKRYCVNWGGIIQHNPKVVASFYFNNSKLRSVEALEFQREAKPLSFGGGEILCFWVPYKGMDDIGNVFKYNLRTRELKVSHESETERCWFLYKSSLVPLPKLSDFHVKS